MVSSKRMIAVLFAALTVMGTQKSFAENTGVLPKRLHPFFSDYCRYNNDYSGLPRGCICGYIEGKISNQCDGNGSCVGVATPMPLPDNPRLCDRNLKNHPH